VDRELVLGLELQQHHRGERLRVAADLPQVGFRKRLAAAVPRGADRNVDARLAAVEGHPERYRGDVLGRLPLVEIFLELGLQRCAQAGVLRALHRRYCARTARQGENDDRHQRRCGAEDSGAAEHDDRAEDNVGLHRPWLALRRGACVRGRGTFAYETRRGAARAAEPHVSEATGAIPLDSSASPNAAWIVQIAEAAGRHRRGHGLVVGAGTTESPLPERAFG
jgi:hypothetical protein